WVLETRVSKPLILFFFLFSRLLRLVFSVSSFSIDTSQPSFLTANNKSCLLNVPNSDTNPFDNAFDFGSDSCFLGQGFGSLTQLRNMDLSSMDRSSILGDAIDYLKELLQRISDLHNELESTPTPPGSFPPTPSSFHLLTPTTQILSFPVKEELHLPFCLYPQVEVRLREGSAVNIHMFCGRRPGLLLATMKALDNLGLDVQQAVISCFNGFALDVFCAEV
ncbi:hypothetical protein HID58_070087, partial [Brassica napus]